MMKEVPNGLLWYFDSDAFKKKKYIKDLDFIKENTECNYVMIRCEKGVNIENFQQCHGAFSEIVDHAHKIGLKIMLHISPVPGFANASVTTAAGRLPEVDQAQVFHTPESENAEAITHDYEIVADENGFAEFCHKALWSRPKIAPIFSNVLRAYAFEKTGDGFYKKDSLVDVTERLNITNSRTGKMEGEIYAGKENAGKTIFVMVAQYVNATGSGEPQWQRMKKTLDAYADIPFDGIGLDEFGMSPLDSRNVNNGNTPPFRGRRYSKNMNEYFSEELNIDLPKMLFDMRYAPEGREEVRIRAINKYFEELRKFPLYTEIRTEKYARELFGDNIYMGVHNTFHNNLDNDEIWSTACNWWDLPREYGHTDENITFPVRLGVMMAAKKPIMIDTYYTQKKGNYLRPYCGRCALWLQRVSSRILGF